MKRLYAALAAIVVSAGIALGAVSITPFTGPQDPSQLFFYLNTLIQALNGPSFQPSVQTFANFRNVLDNGAIAIYQRGTVGTTITTCGTTTIPQTAYGADRWGCNANVTSGAGRMEVVSSTPSPPTGYQQVETLYRTSGSLAQPICAMQEVPGALSTALQGQNVVFSVNIAALAALVADNGGTANMYIFTGTGSDQGFGSFTASPAITPAWTTIATTGSFSVTGLTTSFARFQGTAVIPTATTEIAVAICFTPSTAVSGGTTDGIAFVGAQLEQGTVASSFEFKPAAWDQAAANRYFVAIPESATSGAVQSPAGNGATTTTCSLFIPFPGTMRAAPTFAAYGTALSTSTWTITHVATATALATTYLVVDGANTPTGGSLTATVASGLTAGQTCVLTSAAGGSILGFSADY